MGKSKPDGSPDVDAWLQEVSDKQKVPLAIYRHDVVWPTVRSSGWSLRWLRSAMKTCKRVLKPITVPGPRCGRSFSVRSARRRKSGKWPAAAPRLSISAIWPRNTRSRPAAARCEAKSRPSRHSGQALLEKEAFGLQPGELSSVIQVGDALCDPAKRGADQAGRRALRRGPRYDL